MKWNSIFSGRLEIALTSADIHSALQNIVEIGVEARDITFVDPLHIRFTISRKSYGPLLALCRKRGDSIQILRHLGMRHIISGMRKRPILIAGMLFICILSVWLPTRVFFVRVEGNVCVPTRYILEQAAQCGVQFGASCRRIRSDPVKNALLAAIPQLQWAGVNTYGCTAVINVREGSVQKEAKDDPTIMSIVAVRDAVVRKMTVLEGNPQCTLGDAVTQGQVLVSPYTDCGICIRVTDTKAEIYGDTQQQLTLICPTQYQQRTEIIGRKKKYSLIIGKKRINFYKGSGISGTTCAKIYEEKYMTLSDGFILPIGIVCEEIVEYTLQPSQCDVEPSLLERYSEEYLLSILLGGSIQHADHIFSNGSGSCRLDSRFQCYELIGISRPEEGIKENE